MATHHSRLELIAQVTGHRSVREFARAKGIERTLLYRGVTGSEAARERILVALGPELAAALCGDGAEKGASE